MERITGLPFEEGLYDYESAWKWALAMSVDERAAKFKALRGNRYLAVAEETRPELRT